jgi:spermidine/putrescine transport system substrate-binding protein
MKKASSIFQLLFFTALTLLLFFLLKTPTITKEIEDSTINVYVWGDFFNTELIKTFEKRTGAKVNLNYYLSNEELLAKIRGTKGRCADVVFPSDYAIKALIQEDYLEKLDYRKLDCLDKIDPMVLDKPFDPQNKHSLPYTWEIYGVVANKTNSSTSKITTIQEIMKNKDLERIVMPNDPIEMYCIAAQALFGNIKAKNADEVEQITKLIQEQRKRIQAYVDYQAKFLFASASSDIGFTRSSYYCLIADEAPEHKLKFTPTTDGLFITIENTAILKSSKNKDLIYQFINDIYQENNMFTHIHECPMFPAIASLAPTMDFSKDYLEIYNKAKSSNNLCFFDYYIDEKTIRKEWVKAKAT